MNEDIPKNPKNIINIAEWKEKNAKKIEHAYLDKVNSKEQLIKILQEFIRKLNILLLKRKEGLKIIKEEQRRIEKKDKAVWSEEILNWNKKEEEQIKNLQDFIYKGKLLSIKIDVTREELLEYLKIDFVNL